MATLKYKIEFFSFWHTGSGLSSGTESDLVVIKDKNGLPFIPGKTLKGLLREGAEIINLYNEKIVSKDFIDTVFGERPNNNNNNNIDTPKEAESFFTNATQSEKIRIYFSEKSNQKQLLYKNIASTKINSEGQAVNHSLRQMEVTIPLELYAEVINLPEEYREQLEKCFAWVKKIGLNRTRGMGRCELQTIKIG